MIGTNASAEYVRAADLLPDDRTAQLAAAKALLATGQFEDARTRAERIVQRHPGMSRDRSCAGEPRRA